MKKPKSIVLLSMILLQSCVVYQNKSVSINKAIDTGPVKVTSTRGHNYQFKNVVLRDGNYYGRVKNPYWADLFTDINITDIPFNTTIDSTEISAVYLKDIKKSSQISIIVVSLWAVLFAAFILTFK